MHSNDQMSDRGKNLVRNTGVAIIEFRLGYSCVYPFSLPTHHKGDC